MSLKTEQRATPNNYFVQTYDKEAKFIRIIKEYGTGRLHVKTRKRVNPYIFLWGLRVLHVTRNLHVFTRKTRKLPST